MQQQPQQQQHTWGFTSLQPLQSAGSVRPVSSTPAAMLRTGITPGLKLIPSAVLWGYFAYMAADSLPGSQFWDRLLLVFTDPRKRYV